MSNIDQHSNDSIAFKESDQCEDGQYIWIRDQVIGYLRENLDDEFLDHINLQETQVKRFLFEDGVITFEATHPHVIHEDEMDGQIETEGAL
jgi:hypothetical protein